MSLRSTLSAIAACSALFLIACGGGSGSPTQTPGLTATAMPAASATPAALASPTVEPFRGGRAPVEGSLGAGGQSSAALVDVRTANQGAFERITFEFNAAGPGYRVEYAPSPAQCGSGEAIALSPGQAALQVKFTPAAAHDDAGSPTFGQQTLTPALPSIEKVVQTCDFEADLTWVVILPQPLDFRVTALTNPVRLAVDVAHP